MVHIISKFKIPTLLGLALILISIGIGVFLVLREQTLISQASPDILPKKEEILISNVTENSAVISWQTDVPVISFIHYGVQNPDQVAKDDRDKEAPEAHSSHYITLKNLTPDTSYKFIVTAGKKTSEVFDFKTAFPASSQTGFTPVIGTVLDQDKPLTEGIVYLSINGASTQSSLINSSGAYLIPISHLRNTDKTDIFPLKEDETAKISISSQKGAASLTFKLKPSSNTLPTIKLTESIDLTISTPKNEQSPSPTPSSINFDLNNDGFVNTADNAVLLRNFGDNPQDKRADLNNDGEVDQEDLDLMSEQINR